MRKYLFFLLIFLALSLQAEPKYFPIGTKWTELRLDTTKYDNWYTKSGDEWIPNFEMVEYYVKGDYTAKYWDDAFKCVYTNGPEWTDSLSLFIYEGNDENGNMGVHVTVPVFHESGEVIWPGTAYQFDWEVGKMIEFKDIIHANITTYTFPPGSFDFGRIEEIKEGDFGGVRPLKYVDVNGVRIIQGIGVTTWNDGECIFGPVMPYEALTLWQQVLYPPGTVQSEPRDYRSMLVHFEREGEVLYNIWPEPENENSIGRPTPSPSLVKEGIFDLQGRKLPKAPKKGMYIKDGKKVVKK